MHILVQNTLKNLGSLHSAHLQTIVGEFMGQIGKPSTAYAAKVMSKNQGGFIVEVQGIKAFMPGSLAAANKIVDFDEYIGKNINVMIEDFLASSNIFVVSYKKYLEHILPSRLGELERNQIMHGTVTGSSNFGVFVEFDEIFTGLLHSSEMTSETYDEFKQGGFKPGDTIKVWLKDIRSNKLILTDRDPIIKESEMEEFRVKTEGVVKSALIVSIKPHGALMEIEKGVLGLLPIKEMKRLTKKLSVGDDLIVCVRKVDTSTGKIYLALTDERIHSEV